MNLFIIAILLAGTNGFVVFDTNTITTNKQEYFRFAVGGINRLKVLPGVNYGEWSVQFLVPSVETHQVCVTNDIPGRFWMQWIVETNETPRKAMDGFDNVSSNVWVTGSYERLLITNLFLFNQDQEHIDQSEHQEIHYVSSNLVSFLVWRGQTNRHYLESIPITNIVKRWRYEQRKVYLP